MVQRTWSLVAVVSFFLIGCLLAGNLQAQEKLDVNIRAKKSVYAVGEPIQLEVQGNRDFYLYLFTVDSKTKKPFMLTPENPGQMKKFSAGKAYRFPENGKDLVSDQAGMEKVVMLASAKQIKLPEGAAPKDADELKGLRLVEHNEEKDHCIKDLAIFVQ
ncbi:MAG: hypothetical protein A2X81_12845 [Desulfobacterales bacterium GWB2_56_26]|nr:MAG: hypothetical protein A2X81_12845 [Desulfobacterales bacterium GWB2_56_26]